MFNIPRRNEFSISLGIKDKPYSVYFYRREVDKKNLDQFLDSIEPTEIAWDKPTRQLYYRGPDNQLYKLNFEEVK